MIFLVFYILQDSRMMRTVWQLYSAVNALLLSPWLSSLSVSLQQSTFERTKEQTSRRFLCWNLIC